jgi:lysophospholipase L1-like esterase
MRPILKLLTTTALASALVTVPGTQVVADDQTATHYYLALGDSVAAELQRGGSPDGYVSRVAAALAVNDPKIELKNIACGGESTVSMLSGSQPPDVALSCGPPSWYQRLFPHGTQIDEAVAFLHAHKDRVDLVTINIAANDISCDLDPACVQQVLQQIAVNLDRILAELQAAGPGVRIVGMTYFNPIACLLPVDPTTAAASQQVVLDLNAVLSRVYAAHGVEVADVAGAFSVSDLPASAQAAADWTWFCHPDRFGDPHPNSAGHQVIADAFLDVLAI